MKWNDVINGLFELAGAYFTWRNYFQLRKDLELKGVWWPLIAFMTTWGFWNIVYYPSLDQWFSFAGGVALVGGNAFWVNLALKLRYFPARVRRPAPPRMVTAEVWIDAVGTNFALPAEVEAVVGVDPGPPARLLVRVRARDVSPR